MTSSRTHAHPRRFAGALAALLALLILSPQASGTDAANRPPKFNYTMETLDNGLQVVMLEDHSVPIVHAELWYHVGSKNESPDGPGSRTCSST
jgi:zinc protease